MWPIKSQWSHTARSSGGWTLLPDSEAGRRLCLFSLCRAAWRRAAQLNAAGLGQFGLNSCRHAETQPSLWSDAFTARHQQWKGGRKTEDGQKTWLIPSLLPSYPLHCQMVHFFSPLQFPAYHFLWRHTRTLKVRRSSDPPGSLQGGPRLINWQPFDIVQSVWPPALQAGLPLCVLATLLSPQLFTLVIELFNNSKLWNRGWMPPG